MNIEILTDNANEIRRSVTTFPTTVNSRRPNLRKFANSLNFVGGGDLHNLCIVRHAQWRRKISSKNL